MRLKEVMEILNINPENANVISVKTEAIYKDEQIAPDLIVDKLSGFRFNIVLETDNLDVKP